VHVIRRQWRRPAIVVALAGGSALLLAGILVAVLAGLGAKPIHTPAAVEEAFAAQGILLFEEVNFGADSPGSELQVVLDPEKDFTREPPFRIAIYSGVEPATRLSESDLVAQSKPNDTRLLRARNVVLIYQDEIPSIELGRVQAAMDQLRASGSG
jgi:hypothetical protein